MWDCRTEDHEKDKKKVYVLDKVGWEDREQNEGLNSEPDRDTMRQRKIPPMKRTMKRRGQA